MICHLHYETLPCVQCANRAAHTPYEGLPAPNIIIFKEHTNENLFHEWEKPHPVSTPEQLRDMCNERGETSHYLRDSLIWKSGPRRWV